MKSFKLATFALLLGCGDGYNATTPTDKLIAGTALAAIVYGGSVIREGNY